MSGTVTHAESTVTPAEQALSDAQASVRLSKLFAEYQRIRKDKPKVMNEAAVIADNVEGTGDATEQFLTAFADLFREWAGKLHDLCVDVHKVGTSNPGAAIAIMGGKSNRSRQVNGLRLYDALLRLDGDILRGSIN